MTVTDSIKMVRQQPRVNLGCSVSPVSDNARACVMASTGVGSALLQRLGMSALRYHKGLWM